MLDKSFVVQVNTRLNEELLSNLFFKNYVQNEMLVDLLGVRHGIHYFTLLLPTHL